MYKILLLVLFYCGGLLAGITLTKIDQFHFLCYL